jgi:hypothetical protein
MGGVKGTADKAAKKRRVIESRSRKAALPDARAYLDALEAKRVALEDAARDQRAFGSVWGAKAQASLDDFLELARLAGKTEVTFTRALASGDFIPDIVENETPGYTGKVMDTAAAFAAAARTFSDRELEEYVQKGEVAAALLRERGTTARVPAEPRPVRLDDAARDATSSKSGELAWPTEKWKGSPEELSRKQHAIFVFLRRVWNPFIEETGALVTRQMLRDCDPDAGIAVRNALRTRQGTRHKPSMPPDIRIVLTRDVKKAARERPILYATLHS